MKYSGADTDYKNSEDGDEIFFCIDCGREFVVGEFDLVDTEFDCQESLCPACQCSHDLLGSHCDFCDKPAEHALGSTFYCEDHFDDLVVDD